jgi:hypothetical protein
MAGEFTASPTSQQPFATPQPAAVPSASQAISPPTKQSLKSWWKGFRPPTKSQEPHGNNPSFTTQPPSRQQQHFFASGDFATRIPSDIGPVFQESSMHDNSSVIDSSPPVEVSPASSGRWTSTYHFLVSGLARRTKRMVRHKRRSSSSLQQTSAPRRLRKERTDSVFSKAPFFKKPEGYCRRRAFTANFRSYQSARPMMCGKSRRIPNPKSIIRFLSHVPSTFFVSNDSRQNTKQFVEIVEQPTGIFGVPLRQSITYANVAISLVDGEGKSYIYGYVPIVVAKCGVYLKEKGVF